MNCFNIENALRAVKNTLQDKVADYLDVNRQHINITLIDSDTIAEDLVDWDANENDAAEGQEFETYYRFAYQYREDVKTLDWGEDNYMIWMHIDERNFDMVMTDDEFDKRLEDKKHDVCSQLWYEGE